MLFGEKIHVEYDKNMLATHNAYGEADYIYSLIRLQDPTTVEIPRAKLEDTFCHELLHMILEKLGRQEESSDEILITSMAGLLHQALTTAEYAKDEK